MRYLIAILQTAFFVSWYFYGQSGEVCLAVNIGSFLFGSDPGAGGVDFLKKFLKGDGLDAEATNAALLTGSRARTASGQRSARAGLTGSGLAEDIQGDADLLEADALRRFRQQNILRRLRAAGLLAQQPRQPGFLEAAIPVGAALLSPGVDTTAGGGGRAPGVGLTQFDPRE